MNIIDRRLNPQGKSLSNRRRFIRRAKQELTEAVRKATAERSISDLGGEEQVWVKTNRLKEPQIRHTPRRMANGTMCCPATSNMRRATALNAPQSQAAGRGAEAC